MQTMEEKKVTEKKNQHFVPRFYLKWFSIDRNDKAIRVFNKKLDKFIPSASLYNQASKKYYYGEDGELEDDLAFSEGIFVERLRAILETETLPPYSSREHRTLLHFTVMTEFRNPIKKTAMEKVTEIVGDYAKQHVNFPDDYRNSGIKLGLKDPVAYALSNHNKSVLMISDLHIKLLKNTTNIPFITSDNPVVHYNQFLEQNTKLEGITGYGIKGVQIFIPLSPTYMLMLYDSQVYYVGKRKSKVVSISNPAEIDQLNVLQFLNSDVTCFGNGQVTEEYMKRLYEESKTYPTPRVQIHKKFQTGERTFTVYHAETSCRINLRLSFVAYSTHASRVEFHDDILVYPRDFALDVADALRNDPRFKN